MTKFENFKNMSIEEMAAEMNDKLLNACDYCNSRICGLRTENACINGIIDWLQSEVEK